MGQSNEAKATSKGSGEITMLTKDVQNMIGILSENIHSLESKLEPVRRNEPSPALDSRPADLIANTELGGQLYASLDALQNMNHRVLTLQDQLEL